jgi:hypothetical protein
VVWHTLLDPISGLIVATELQRLEQKLFLDDWAEATERLGRDPKASELSRTPDQRRADALVEMATRSAATPPGAKAPKPLFTVVFGNEAFAHYCQLSSGVVLPPGALLSWMGEAELERILFEGKQGRVIDVSHKRSFLGALRRLIEVRDGVCFHDFCEEPDSRCEVDRRTSLRGAGTTRLSSTTSLHAVRPPVAKLSKCSGTVDWPAACTTDSSTGDDTRPASDPGRGRER